MEMYYFAVIGLLALLVYYRAVWVWLGRGLPRGPVAPRPYPPDGTSPAASRFIWRMWNDEEAFAAALVDMAVKGFLTIRYQDGAYTLVSNHSIDIEKCDRVLNELNSGTSATLALLAQRAALPRKSVHAVLAEMIEQGFPIDIDGDVVTLDSTKLRSSIDPLAGLWPEERKAAKILLGSKQALSVSSIHASRISEARGAFEANLLMRVGEHYVVPTGIYRFVGVLLSVVALIVFGYRTLAGDLGATLLGMFGTLFFGIGSYLIYLAYTAYWNVAFSGKRRRAAILFPAFVLSVFALPLTAAGATALILSDMPYALFVMGAVLVNLRFFEVLKARTPDGVALLAQIEGFRRFLSDPSAEPGRGQRWPDDTPEIFEEYLPYAIALDVERAWARRFVPVFTCMQERGTPYQPSWYGGRTWDPANAEQFAEELGSIFCDALYLSGYSGAPVSE